MLGFMDLRQPRAIRRSNVGLVILYLQNFQKLVTAIKHLKVLMQETPDNSLDANKRARQKGTLNLCGFRTLQHTQSFF